MAWKPIVVAVDDSPEAAVAAALGWQLAAAAGTSCHLVHAVQDPGTAFASMVMQKRSGELGATLLALVGPKLRAALGGTVAPEAFDTLRIRVGRTAMVLKAEVEELGAGLVIVGGKHHLALGRWLGGSTAHEAMRSLNVPVLVTKNTPGALRRVLVAVDLSYAAQPTIRGAEQFALLSGGALRAIHVLEPLTLVPEVAQFVTQQQFDADTATALERDVWPLLRVPGAERTMRAGDAATALAAEAAEWRADLLVVGSHGKGWVERLRLGTVTERLLNQLPVSLLVVPVGKGAPLEEPAQQAASRGRTAPPLGVATTEAGHECP